MWFRSKSKEQKDIEKVERDIKNVQSNIQWLEWYLVEYKEGRVPILTCQQIDAKILSFQKQIADHTKWLTTLKKIHDNDYISVEEHKFLMEARDKEEESFTMRESTNFHNDKLYSEYTKIEKEMKDNLKSENVENDPYIKPDITYETEDEEKESTKKDSQHKKGKTEVKTSDETYWRDEFKDEDKNARHAQEWQRSPRRRS